MEVGGGLMLGDVDEYRWMRRWRMCIRIYNSIYDRVISIITKL